ncbi:MAG: hypothetical protein KAR32_14705, partial [Candidatus Omnitrophica bacterium]|nr:hypothetical protein [Candidatus Omnitrophota bacterium]
MSNIEYLSQGSRQKANIAFLRFRVDTLGENFIYEESGHFRCYCPIVLCGKIERLNKEISCYCYDNFAKLYNSRWPIFPKSQKGIYAKGINAYKEIIKKKNIRLIHAQFLTDA